MPSLIAVGMGVLAGSAPLPQNEAVLGPQLSVVVGSNHGSLAVEAAGMMGTQDRDRGGSLGVVAKLDPLALRRGHFTVIGSLEAIAQHEWWNVDGIDPREGRTVYGGGIGVAISSPDLRNPRALSRVHLDLRVLAAPHALPATAILARAVEPEPAGRDLGVLVVVGGELGAIR